MTVATTLRQLGFAFKHDQRKVGLTMHQTRLSQTMVLVAMALCFVSWIPISAQTPPDQSAAVASAKKLMTPDEAFIIVVDAIKQYCFSEAEGPLFFARDLRAIDSTGFSFNETGRVMHEVDFLELWDGPIMFGAQDSQGRVMTTGTAAWITRRGLSTDEVHLSIVRHPTNPASNDKSSGGLLFDLLASSYRRAVDRGNQITEDEAEYLKKTLSQQATNRISPATGVARGQLLGPIMTEIRFDEITGIKLTSDGDQVFLYKGEDRVLEAAGSVNEITRVAAAFEIVCRNITRMPPADSIVLLSSQWRARGTAGEVPRRNTGNDRDRYGISIGSYTDKEKWVTSR